MQHFVLSLLEIEYNSVYNCCLYSLSENTMSMPLHNTSLTTQDDFLDYALSRGFGDLHFKVDPDTGMKAIIAIHNTNLGPALGGCRFIEYFSLNEAIQDVMRLALGMSYKSAMANLPLGGGKAVIIKPKTAYNRKQYLQKFGKFVNELQGRYITAMDSGTDLSDMDMIATQTSYIASTSNQGDPSPTTADGVFHGIEAAVKFKLNTASLANLHVTVQGLGHVGHHLVEHLANAGARLTVADINTELAASIGKKYHATVVPPSIIHQVPCDVFAPCALGGILNEQTIPQLQASIVAGAANNQLLHAEHGLLLHQRNILYAPDYVINAGGVIFAGNRYLQMDDITLKKQVRNIAETLQCVFERAAQENLPTNVISDAIAKERIASYETP